MLGTRTRRRGTAVKKRVVEERHSMIYVPTLKNLQALLSNDAMRNEVIQPIVKQVEGI